METEAQSPTPTNANPPAAFDTKFTLETLENDLPVVADTEIPADADGEKQDPPPQDEAEKPAPETDDEKPADEEKPEPESEKEGEEKEADDKPKGTRDYTKFPAEIQPFMKQMSKAAFDKIGPMLIEGQNRITQLTEEKKKLESTIAEHKGEKLPDDWYSHPEAYRVTPQYQEIEKQFNASQKEVDHWSNILVGLRENSIRYDPAAKDFVENTDENFKNNARIIQQVDDKRLEAYERAKEFAAKGNALAEKFQSKHKEGAGYMTAQMDKLFPWHKDEKHANQDAYKKILADFPETFREHPVTKFAAAASLKAIQFWNLYQDALKQVKAKAQVREDAKLAGPVPGKKTKASSDASEVKYKEDDMTGM